jgi:hypothetical protein
MLSQNEADQLIRALKELKAKSKLINFPQPTEYLSLEAESDKDKFIFDINRRGQYNLKKCTYQTRYKKQIKLLRIDIEGPAHDNPNGETIPCPHIHIYREGYNLSWAYPLPEHIKADPSDLIQVLIDFLMYNNVNNTKDFSFQEGGLV